MRQIWQIVWIWSSLYVLFDPMLSYPGLTLQLDHWDLKTDIQLIHLENLHSKSFSADVYPISLFSILMKVGSVYCKKPWRKPKRSGCEWNVNNACDIGGATASVLSLDGIFRLKEVQRTALKAFLGEKIFFTLLPAGLSKNLVKCRNPLQLIMTRVCTVVPCTNRKPCTVSSWVFFFKAPPSF